MAMKIQHILKQSVRHPQIANSMFPGAVRLGDGSLLMLFVSGSGFESSDMQVFKAFSTDEGATWNYAGSLYDRSKLPFSVPFSDTYKPTLLADGSLLAAGYGFLRDRPELGLSDYAEKYGCFPECRNAVLWSHDHGNTWTIPQVIEHSYAGMELSGTALLCADGNLRFFAPPFLLKTKEQRGLVFESADNGKNWKETGTFFASKDNVAPWEVRSIQLPSGRIVLVLWMYDLKNQKHLNTHLVYSDDNGRTWNGPLDTGLRGQASSLMLWRGQLGIVQARRELPNPGIYLSMVKFDGDASLRVTDEACILDAAGMANAGERIEHQFLTMKFGQPSTIPLKNDEYLLFFWFNNGSNYSIQVRKFRVEK